MIEDSRRRPAPLRLQAIVLCGAFLLIAAVRCTSPKTAGTLPYAAAEGDLLFQSLPHSPLVDAIETATKSPWSHCGILVQADDGWAVLEAIGPVKTTPLDVWLRQSRDGKLAAYRWRDTNESFVTRLIAAAQAFAGRPYDPRYELDDEKIYCSELIYKAYRSITGRPLGRLAKLGELNWQPIESTIRELEGGGLPLAREIISPQALTEAPELARVF